MSFLLVKILNAHFNVLTYFTGMLSKAKGQILRVSALLNMLFAKFEENDSIDSEHIPLVITEKALTAAQNFVEVACQHAAFLAGRGNIEAELKHFSTGLSNISDLYSNALL